MTDKKKKYLAPEMSVIEIEQTDIICTSTSAFSLDNDGQLGSGNSSDWGDPLTW